MGEEWFRSGDWDKPAQTAFEAKLARARPRSRQQYLNIKGGALARAGLIDAAIELKQRSIDLLDGYDFHRNSAREQIADLRLLQSRKSEAEELYRYVIRHPAPGGGTTTCIDIKLLELIIDRKDPAAREEAAQLIEARLRGDYGPWLNSDLFLFAMCLTRHAKRSGDKVEGDGLSPHSRLQAPRLSFLESPTSASCTAMRRLSAG